MLVIRLSRHGRKNLPAYRIVLTEHTKPVKFGYKEVLGSYDPLNHIVQVDIEAILAWIKKGARPSERVAKLLYKETNNNLFNRFFEYKERNAKSKKEKNK